MAKLHPSVVKRPARKERAFTFADPANPALTFTVTLRRLGTMELTAATELAQDKIRQYLDGTGDPNAKNYNPPEPFPPVDGQGVELSRTACNVFAGLQYAQVGPEEDLYTFEELVSFATVDEVSRQMVEAYGWIVPDDGSGGDDDGPLAVTTT